MNRSNIWPTKPTGTPNFWPQLWYIPTYLHFILMGVAVVFTFFFLSICKITANISQIQLCLSTGLYFRLIKLAKNSDRNQDWNRNWLEVFKWLDSPFQILSEEKLYLWATKQVKEDMFGRFKFGRVEYGRVEYWQSWILAELIDFYNGKDWPNKRLRDSVSAGPALREALTSKYL